MNWRILPQSARMLREMLTYLQTDLPLHPSKRSRIRLPRIVWKLTKTEINTTICNVASCRGDYELRHL